MPRVSEDVSNAVQALRKLGEAAHQEVIKAEQHRDAIAGMIDELYRREDVCPYCNGDGSVKSPDIDPLGSSNWDTCVMCEGSGKYGRKFAFKRGGRQ